MDFSAPPQDVQLLLPTLSAWLALSAAGCSSLLAACAMPPSPLSQAGMACLPGGLAHLPLNLTGLSPGTTCQSSGTGTALGGRWKGAVGPMSGREGSTGPLHTATSLRAMANEPVADADAAEMPERCTVVSLCDATQ